MPPPLALRVQNPGTGATIAEVATATAADVDGGAGAGARGAAGVGRAAVRRAGARAAPPHPPHAVAIPTLIDTLVGESGKPRYEAEAIELFYTCELTRYYTGRAGRRALRDDVRHPLVFANKRARVVYHPRGVVGVIGPWNWPLLNNFADCVAPLVCGNAVVLKPSEWTPLTSLRVLALWRELGLPEDVFQVVTGKGDVGQALCEQVDMIFFTGSQKVGRQIARDAGERLIPVVLELGGKSPMLVLADADLPRAAHAAVWSGFAHSGQVCVRTERVLVEEPVAERFVELCAAEVAQPAPGPVAAAARRSQRRRLRRRRHHLRAAGRQRARADRRRRRQGRARRRPAAPSAPIWRRAVLRADADRRRHARDGGDARRDLRAGAADHARRPTPRQRCASPTIRRSACRAASGRATWRGRARWPGAWRSGSVCVNDVLVNYFCVEAPLGGVKASGIGVRHGPEGLRQFCRLETVVEDRAAAGPAHALREQPDHVPVSVADAAGAALADAPAVLTKPFAARSGDRLRAGRRGSARSPPAARRDRSVCGSRRRSPAWRPSRACARRR